MGNQKEVKRFVEPKNQLMNQLISDFLEQSRVECEHGEQLCDDGERHMLWVCPEQLYRHLVENQRKFKNGFLMFEKTPDGNYEYRTIPPASRIRDVSKTTKAERRAQKSQSTQKAA